MNADGMIVSSAVKPLDLARALEAVRVKSSAPARFRSTRRGSRSFQVLVERLGLKQPANGTLLYLERSRRSYSVPGAVRASPGGRLESFTMKPNESVCRPGPGSVAGQAGADRQLSNRPWKCIGIAVDGHRTFIGWRMSKSRRRVHSGDSACVIPPHSLSRGAGRGDQTPDARNGQRIASRAQ